MPSDVLPGPYPSLSPSPYHDPALTPRPAPPLPAAIDAQSPLTASELAVLRQQYLDEAAKGWVSVQTRFNFAWGSVKSEDRVEVGEGVALLMGAFPPSLARRAPGGARGGRGD